MKRLLIFMSPDWLNAICSPLGKTDVFKKSLMQVHCVKHFPSVVQLYQPGDTHHLELQHTIMTGTNLEQEQFPSNFLYPRSCRMHRMLQFVAVAVTLLWCQAMAVLMALDQSFPCSRGCSTPGVLYGAGLLLEHKVQLFVKASYPKILREQTKVEIISNFEFFKSVPGIHKHKPSF